GWWDGRCELFSWPPFVSIESPSAMSWGVTVAFTRRVPRTPSVPSPSSARFVASLYARGASFDARRSAEEESITRHVGGAPPPLSMTLTYSALSSAGVCWMRRGRGHDRHRLVAGHPQLPGRRPGVLL